MFCIELYHFYLDIPDSNSNIFKKTDMIIIDIDIAISKTNKIFLRSSGLYYKHATIVIYNRNDSVQYHKTTITIVIDDP